MKNMKALIVILLALSAIPAFAAPLQKITVQNAQQRKAICNDGSPAVYYFRPGSGEGANRWAIYLQGGGFCSSVNTCKLRERATPQYMTSTDKPATYQGIGLLSDVRAQNPDFYNSNQVYIAYCSSDLWSGNRPHSVATGEYEFRGQLIFRAVIADLKKRTTGANLKTATEILLWGTSAGGIGTMVHLDWLASQVLNAKVRGFNDAGFIPPAIDNLPIQPSFSSSVSQGILLWNGKPDASCAAANSAGKYGCYLSTAYPHITTPLFVQQSQWDSYALGFLANVGPPFDASEQPIADAYASAVRASLGPVEAAFSPRTFIHPMAILPLFNSMKVNGLSLRKVLGTWFFDRPGPVKAITK